MLLYVDIKEHLIRRTQIVSKYHNIYKTSTPARASTGL